VFEGEEDETQQLQKVMAFSAKAGIAVMRPGMASADLGKMLRRI